MSQTVAKFTPLHAKYWEVWKQGKLRGLTDEQIGESLHRSRQTITRVKREAKDNGTYKEWVNETLDTATEEFWELHTKIKALAPHLAYAQMGKFIEKSLVQRIEASKNIHVREEHVDEKRDVTILAEYKAAIESAVDRDINALRARKQVDSSKTQVTTT
jgi:hypothetical protein